MSLSVDIHGKLRPMFSKVTSVYEWFCTERAQKMPVPNFFKWILSWSPQSFSILKLTPLHNLGIVKSDMIASQFGLFETYSLSTISTSARSFARRIWTAHGGFTLVIFIVSVSEET